LWVSWFSALVYDSGSHPALWSFERIAGTSFVRFSRQLGRESIRFSAAELVDATGSESCGNSREQFGSERLGTNRASV
jgi:hypothetical protein